MSLRSHLRKLVKDDRGAAAVEYGFVLPIFLLVVMGAIWGGMLMYSVSSLNLAVQQAARCMSVDATNCPTATAAQTYAMSHYAGPNISPVFTATATGCGHTVGAQANFNLGILPGVPNIPLTASACYP
jgi:Flp pilus assembly protein TadG